jgi:FixJ family two-component response regulator
VYVIEDNDLVRHLHVERLERAGLQVCASDCVASFLLQFDPDQPGCVLLDVDMPGISGLELQRQLNEQGAVIPLVFASGATEGNTAAVAMAHGAHAFLAKPVRAAQLLEAVRAAIAADTRLRSVPGGSTPPSVR